jgi:hypothetical protein
MAKLPSTALGTGAVLWTELAEIAVADAGRGISTDPADQSLPLIYILQTGSPACEKRGADYIDGAEPGHFLLRGATDPIRSGVEGIVAINCGMRRAWLEWLPDRGGYADRHDRQPDDVVLHDDGRKPRLIRRDSKNVIEETREVFLLIEGRPYLLPCPSTRNQFAREWNTYCGQFTHPTTGKTLPSFAREYQLTTVKAENALGKWFKPKFTDLGWVSDIDIYKAARALNAIVESGRVRGDYHGADAAA